MSSDVAEKVAAKVAVKKDYVRPLDFRHGHVDMNHGAGGRAASRREPRRGRR